MSNYSNDATKKLLGFEYQKLIALEICLNAKPNETIWIECKGDIADDTQSLEIKHHESGGNITSNSVDVWKTLKNYVEESDLASEFDQLILHTTSKINDDSIFYNWENLSSHEKRDKLILHTPSETIQDFFKKVSECKEDILLKILSKFSILEKQPSIQQKTKELENHPAFMLIDTKFRSAALSLLHGYITRQAIDNSNEWKVNINDFNRDFRSTLSKFTQEKTPFPIFDPQVIDQSQPVQNYKFIDKMQTVNLNKKAQANAVSDYLRANLSQIELIQFTPTLVDNLNRYDESVFRMIEDEKASKAINVSHEQIDTPDLHKTSQHLYFDCINKSHDQVDDVQNTQKYYRDGRIHHNLETTEFEWKFNQDDI